MTQRALHPLAVALDVFNAKPAFAAPNAAITATVAITVQNSLGTLQPNLPVYAFDGTIYTGYTGTTNASGKVTLTLPEGNYRFRADKLGRQFFSGDTNHCTIPGCDGVTLVIPMTTVTVTVQTSLGALQPNLPVYAFDGTSYTGYSATTNAAGQAALVLPNGNYRFRADKQGKQFFSDTANHCTTPGCANVTLTIPVTSVTVTVQTSLGALQPNLPVYAFDGTTYTGYGSTTNISGTATLVLPDGNYCFRADKNSKQFFSGTVNHCTTPTCTTASLIIPVTPVTVTVQDSLGTLQPSLPVYAFDGATYTGYSATTNISGTANIVLPEGNYRFRADKQGKQFFSGATNHCTIPGCASATVMIYVGSVSVTVQDSLGTFQPNLPVYAFDGATYTGYGATTNITGTATLVLPDGNYRFRADKLGRQYFSAPSNHCATPTCTNVSLIIPVAVITVTVQDSQGTLQPNLPVYAYDGATYTGYSGTTNISGTATIVLPEGNYRFRADKQGKQFFSAPANHRTIPGCTTATVVISVTPVTVTVQDGLGILQPNLPVYAFDGTTYTGYGSTTSITGAATLILPDGNYRFRADKNSKQFYSGTVNHCTTPTCTVVSLIIPVTPVTVTVQDILGTLQPSLPVYAFDGATYTGYSATTDISGTATIILPDGGYRFRADKQGKQFFSNSANHCTTPTCTTASLIIPVAPVTVTVQDSLSNLQPNLPVYVFDSTTYTGYSGTTDISGTAALVLPYGNYRFRADKNGKQFFSGTVNQCSVPTCTVASVVIPVTNVAVTVQDSYGTRQPSLPVYAFDGATYTGYSATTDISGTATIILPDGGYRFRADKQGKQFFSNTANHCTTPTCTTASLIIPVAPVTVTVQDSLSNLQPNLPVYAFDGTTYTGYSGTTSISGMASIVLPYGNYRFRADKNGKQFFSNAANHCSVPTCTVASLVIPVTNVAVTVQDSYGTRQPSLPVYAFDNTTYTGYNATTNISGTATLTLPDGSYRFRADKQGKQFYSNANNHCTTPTCTAASLIIPVGTVTVTVKDNLGTPQASLPVYAMDNATYSGYSATTNVSGTASLVLPNGSYRFRADKAGQQYFSGATNHCTVPGCTSVPITITPPTQTTVVNYTYDPLYRLTQARATGAYTDTFAYTYDAVGNRLSVVSSQSPVVSYTYDNANRLTSVNGQAYTWDANGNLLNDGARAYTYDQANRLKAVSSGQSAASTYAYNGLGDRVSQTVNGTQTRYALDPAAGLTQVLSDGTNAYLYGQGRIAQYQTAMQYFGADALGSVRQMYSASGQVVANARYDPYGSVVAQSGVSSAYGFAGEQQDASTGLEYLRARYYASAQGRFLSRDPFPGRPFQPSSLHQYMYARDNPTMLTDPSGRDPSDPDDPDCLMGDWVYDFQTGTEFYDCRLRRTNSVGQALRAIVPGLPQNDIMYNPLTGRDESLTGYVYLNQLEPRLNAWNQISVPATEFSINLIPGGNVGYNAFMSRAERNPFTGAGLSDEQRQSYAVSGALGFAGDFGPCFFPFVVGGLKSTTLVRATLPKLTGSVKNAFEGGSYVLRTFKKGEVIYRSPVVGELAGDPNRWFSTRRTVTVVGTESTINARQWLNPVKSLRTYRFTEDVTLYYGKVAGGTGYQAFFPSDVTPGSVLQFAGEELLK